MVTARPHTATLSWTSGGNYDTGKLSGGVVHTQDVKCRIVDIVGELTVADGRKLAVRNKVFIDPVNLTGMDEATLQISFNGIRHKVLRASKRQTHIKLWL
jgi:hypothetical protein